MDVSPSRSRLVMVGACYIDTILSVPSYPAEDEKLRASALERRRGGNVGNSLEVMQQLVAHHSSGPSFDLNLMCPMPNAGSRATAFIKESFGPGVDLSMCLYRSATSEAASSYIFKSLGSGSRTIVNYNEVDEMTFEEFKDQVMAFPPSTKQRTWFHFEGRIPDTSVTCMRWLKQTYPSVTISSEVEKPARTGLEAMAAEADVAFFAKGWAQVSGYENLNVFLLAQAKAFPSARLLCGTWGGEGAAVIKPSDRSYYHEPAFMDPTRPVVDTVGAGDTFVAGMLYRLMAEDEANAKEALAFANHLAGRKVLQNGFANLM